MEERRDKSGGDSTNLVRAIIFGVSSRRKGKNHNGEGRETHMRIGPKKSYPYLQEAEKET